MMFIVAVLALYGPLLELPGEEVSYSFLLEDSSVVSFVSDAGSVSFRWGYPDTLFVNYSCQPQLSSRNLFSISSYFRGGGEQNEGMELYSVKFVYNDSIYEVYDNYYSAGEVYATGLTVFVGPDTMVNAAGLYSSRTGNMNQLLERFQTMEDLQ